jgi:NAD(P)H-dependent flavin oxidoreductase YrpB (nitropropane dioxygenase family)
MGVAWSQRSALGGAAGVSMGTQFTASRESLWDQAMKAAMLTASGDQTEQTRVFDVVRGAPWPAIYPRRALRNAFSARWHGHEEALAADQHRQEQASFAGLGDQRHPARAGRAFGQTRIQRTQLDQKVPCHQL